MTRSRLRRQPDPRQSLTAPLRHHGAAGPSYVVCQGVAVPPDSLRSDLPHRLREPLLAADFTPARVADLLGPRAEAALRRNETVPAMRRTGGGSPLETLVRLFWLQRPVPHAAAEAALPGLIEQLVTEGLVASSGGEVKARLELRPYSEAAEVTALWVLGDLTPGMDGRTHRVQPDQVLGVSNAATSLAQQTLRTPAERALDLGTGCGIQALSLAGHADQVVATDVSARALWFTNFNAALNDLTARIQTRAGSLFEPVAGERFDRIVTNPPFVISPGTEDQLVYRDSGMPRDEMVEAVVRGLPEHLAPGGWGQVLANWIIAADRPWDERLAQWLAPTCDALVVQREILDPAAYVELWLRDAGVGDRYTERYDAWLAWMDEQQIEAIGFGWINLHRLPEGQTACRHDLLEWPYDVESPIAPAIGGWGEAVSLDRAVDDATLLATHLTARADVRQETHGQPGEADPEQIVLRQQRGFRRARTADTVVAGFVGAADGDLSAGEILGALATLLTREPGALIADYLPVLRELLREGFLDAPDSVPAVGR